MINIPQNTQLSNKFIDLIRSFNELEYKPSLFMRIIKRILD